MATYLKKTITVIISIFSSLVLIGGLNIGTKEIDKAKKIKAIRNCRSQLIEYKESDLMSFIAMGDLNIEEISNNPNKQTSYREAFNSYAPIKFWFNNKKFITGVPISNYIKLIDTTNQLYKIMQFDFQIFANNYLYNCIAERNLFVSASRKVKGKNILSNNN